MTVDSDTNVAHGLGGDDGPTPDPGPFASMDDEDDDLDGMDSLLAAVAAAPAVPLERAEGLGIAEGTVVDGTYRVLRRLGGGGMGIVYLAEHVELQRQVALKLHLGAIESHELQRLRREARVMAQLSHPNVLVVHDVGTHQGRMFFAMEHAEGGTLRTWLERGPRPWRETLAMLVPAGRGLGAAHRVGVVHRDFKPDNVLLGADGRPRVADFGLARRWDDPSEPSVNASSFPRTDDAHHLTVTGAVVGTPAYMSPEQFGGGEVGPASDQFSFCVVLYEALVGRRPFAATRVREQLVSFERGAAIPPRSSMPRSLWRVIRRGLAFRPEDRWPTMDALLAALLAVPRRRRIAAIAAFTIPMAGLLVVAGRASSTSEPAPEVDPCEQALHVLDESWSDARADALIRAFEATALPFASTSADAARRGLDDWSAAWLAERQQLCRATASAEAPAEVLGLRGACLEQQRGHFDATVEVLLGADAQAVTRVHDQLAHLPEPAACRDDRLLLLGIRPPPADQADAVAELRRTLARTQAERLAGHPGVALELVTPAMAAAEATGYPPVLAEALTEGGEVMLDHAERQAQGLALLQRAVDLAEASHHDRLAARIWLDLAFEAASTLRDEVRGRSELRRAEAANERVGVSALTRARLELLRGKLEQLAGRGDAAEAALRAALEQLDHAEEASARLVRPAALAHLAKLLAELDRHDEALALRRQALEAAQEGYGPAHPNVATHAFALGQALQAVRRDDEAIAPLEQAATLWLRSPQVPDAELGVALLSLAQVSLASGELEAAERRARDAAAIFARSLPPVHHRHGDAGMTLAVIAEQRGDHEAALPHFQHAAEQYERSLGPQAPILADVRVNAGITLLELQRLDDARVQLQAALESPHPGPHVAIARLGLTLVALHQGDAAAARAQLDASAVSREALDDSDRIELELLQRITRLRAGQPSGPCSPALRAAFDEPSHADHEHVEWLARLVTLSPAERQALALPAAPDSPRP